MADAKDAPPAYTTEPDILKGDIAVGAVAGDEVRHAIAEEKNLSFFESLKLHKKAVG